MKRRMNRENFFPRKKVDNKGKTLPLDKKKTIRKIHSSPKGEGYGSQELHKKSDADLVKIAVECDVEPKYKKF